MKSNSPDPVRVYAPGRTARHEAAFEWVFTSVLKLHWSWEDSLERYLEDDRDIRCHYGASSDLPGIEFLADGLLSELGQNRGDPPSVQGEKADLFAAVFWMGSRMEEHFDGVPRDEHGRFDPSGSIPMRKGWLSQPICELWSFQIGRRLLGEKAWSGHVHRLQSAFRVEATLDVDSAYAFLGKGLYRTLGAAARDVVRFNWRHLKRRLQALLGLIEDPYNTYALASGLHKEHGIQVRWFFLLAQFGPHDKGLPASSSRLAKLMRGLEEEDGDQVHWHPGHDAAYNEDALRREHRAFEGIMGRPPLASRQHYLRMEPTESRRRLLALGIREDHTEGHAKFTGFRGGFARQRRWYDLEAEALTDLYIFPFAAMDATFLRHLKVRPEDVPGEVVRLADAARETGGTLRLLWHNESLASEGQWQGWGGVYPAVLNAVC
jgi:hypothetical protein